MDTNQLMKATELQKKIHNLKEAQEEAQEFATKVNGDDNHYWGTFSEHSDGGGAQISLAGTRTVNLVLKAITSIINHELELAEKEFSLI